LNAPATPPNDASPVQQGTILAGKYRVERVIGRGGMGVVVEARHVALDERVALKFLTPEYALHPEAAARFLREARAAVKIKSEHVARVSDVGTLETGSPYMVMEFLEGMDLSHALQKFGNCQIPDAVDYILQTCEAIAEAHAHGIIHRDLKPANLFLTRRPDGTPMIKVLDFGISKMAGNAVDNLTKTTASMGSALYMSPEQMQQTRGVDHRTDIYALGISLYELLAGKQPFYADTLPQLCAEVLTGAPTPLRQLRAEVPEGLGVALEKAYARDKEGRYQNIAELTAGLAPYAPARSQTTLDRIARMAGMPSPIAGAPPRTGVGSSPNLAAQSGASGTGYAASAGQTGNFAAQQGQTGQTGNFAAQQAANGQTGHPPTGPQYITGMPGALAIPGYQGPLSEKAAAAFASGASTNTNLSSTGGMQPPSSRAALAAVAMFAAVLLVAGGAFFWLRGRGDTAPAALPADAASATSASVTATGAATGAPTAEPTVSAIAPGTAEPAPSGTAAASVAPSASVAPGASATPTTRAKTPGTKPTGTAKKPGVMTSR